MIASLAALGAAFCWAAGGLIAVAPVRALGPLAFNRIRMTVVAVMLAAAVTVLGRWGGLDGGQVGILALSGLVGVVLGDSALFWALARIGPRRNTVLYATNAPMTALLGWMFLGESLGMGALAGIALTTVGVMVAVTCRLTPAQSDAPGASQAWEWVNGSLAAGIAAALTAALCQAAGSVIARPAMAAGADPLAAAAVRVAAAALVLLGASLLPGRRGGLIPPALRQPRILGLVLLNGAMGLGLGMTLLMVGLAHGSVGVVATLSATSPVLMLPLLWMLTGKPAGPGAWAGAIVAVAGVALVVNR